ncbi:hypothetical protein P775_28565 [Puniceibacterium antarcticum]|uniref:Uncharacterized protein n=1 Tax=Puniceibacterium antarcticum TaxID=1206336 RepID=A0A2G8QT33_9RHOB|nr:hypothetical protein P775_28565 [Puniceibacterium antarcticum]
MIRFPLFPITDWRFALAFSAAAAASKRPWR